MALKKYALSDVCTIVPGFAFKSNEFGSGENIAVKIKDIEPPSVNIKNAERVCFTPQDKFRLSKGDYIMAMTGATIGKVGKLQIDAKNVYINQRVCKFNPITSVCDKEYLYYVLSAPSFRNFIYNNVDSKLAQPNIGHPTIYKYTHLFPTDIKEQKLIASVLNNIDRKIELNKQINDNLEATAKQLYDYWFVQFDFPNEEGKPYKSSGGAMVWNEKQKREIPQGLGTPKIGDIEKNIITGKTPSCADEDNFGGDIPFVTIDDIRGNLFVFKAQRTLSTKGADSQEKKYLPIGSLSVSCIGTVGVMGFVARLAQTNQQINSIVFEHEYNKEFLYFSLKLYFENAKAKSGNVFANMSKEEFASIIVAYPPKQILQTFHNKVAPIFDSIKNNIEEINSLTKQRNELLPLLMNGQATVNYHLSDD